MTVTHIVAFRYKDAAASSAAVAERFFGLKEMCKLNGESYIQSLEGGPQSSSEGYGKSLQVRARLCLCILMFITWPIQYCCVVSFASPAHRDYYVDKDPAHDSFKSLSVQVSLYTEHC